jgi:DNA-binding response OmpR family regulator
MARAPRILLVDDDPVIVRLLQLNFRLEGFEVETASRGDEALERAVATAPDAIVLDVMMPGLDGWEVCRRLKQTPGFEGTPIVFLSARTGDEDRQRGYALGVVSYVTKPFDPQELVAVVRRAIEDAGTG